MNILEQCKIKRRVGRWDNIVERLKGIENAVVLVNNRPLGIQNSQSVLEILKEAKDGEVIWVQPVLDLGQKQFVERKGSKPIIVRARSWKSVK